jgi:hypothetical protein
MAKYLVTYDLVGTDETSDDYERLIEKIKTYGDPGRIQKSVWLIKSDKSAAEIRAELWEYMDSNDRLAVILITGTSSVTRNLADSAWYLNFMETE